MTRFNGPVSRYTVSHTSRNRTPVRRTRMAGSSHCDSSVGRHQPPSAKSQNQRQEQTITPSHLAIFQQTGRSVIYIFIYILLEYAGGIRTADTTVVVVTAIGGGTFGIRVRRVATAHFRGTTTRCPSTTTILPTTSTNPQPFVHSTTESPTFKTAEATATTAVVSER